MITDEAMDRLNKDFSEIIVTVDLMKMINSEWGDLNNVEYYEALEELRDKITRAFDFYNEMIGKKILGPEAE